jgi:hypothetical protein
MAVSEFGQLGARRHDPHTARTEIHQQGGVNLDADDPAEAVRIVGNLVLHGELLRRGDGWGAEGTSGQEAPGRGVGWLHPSSMRSFLTGCAGLTLAGAGCWPPRRAGCRGRVRVRRRWRRPVRRLRLFVESTVLTNTGSLRDTATIAFVISPVIMSGYRSRPRWLMALADCGAAEMLGASDAGMG